MRLGMHFFVFEFCNFFYHEIKYNFFMTIFIFIFIFLTVLKVYEKSKGTGEYCGMIFYSETIFIIRQIGNWNLLNYQFIIFDFLFNWNVIFI